MSVRPTIFSSLSGSQAAGDVAGRSAGSWNRTGVAVLRLLVTTFVFAAVAVAPSGQAAAAGSPQARVSGPSPYAACSAVSPGDTLYPNAEVEPDATANPARPGNLIAVWQQDRWANGGAHGLMAGYSFDGDRSWGRATLPFSRCAPNGAPYNRASDPAVSIGPDGTAYAIGLSFDQTTPRDAVTSAVSTDGGRSWTRLRSITHDTTNGLDKEWITADPTHPGTAYAVWDNTIVDAAGHFRGPAFFAKTTDHARTWSAPIPIAATGRDQQTLGNQILVDPRTGRLYDSYAYYFCTCPSIPKIAYVTSDDGGHTWSRQHVVSDLLTVGVTEPGTGAPLRSGGFPVAAISATGRVYLTWQDSRFSGGSYDEIALTTTSDGGRHWSTPQRANTPTGRPAFTPAVAVNHSGDLAISYYDVRRDNIHDTPFSTDYWATTSTDGQHFSPARHLAGSFDILSAPFARGFFLGDYEGLTATGNRFIAIYAQTNCTGAICPANPTDIYSTAFPATGRIPDYAGTTAGPRPDTPTFAGSTAPTSR